MNLAALISLCAMVASLVATAVGVRLTRAAGWRDQTPLVWAAVTAALYSAFNLPSTAGPWMPNAGVVAATRLQLAVAALHALCWLRYLSAFAPAGSRRPERVLEAALAGAAAIFAVPGAAFGDRVTPHALRSLHATYRLVDTTALGALLTALVVGSLAFVALRFVGAWRAGRPDAGPLALAFTAFFGLAANDAAALAGLVHTPFLVEPGLFLPLGVAAWGLGGRFIREARELALLRTRLEALAEQRSEELARALERLRRSERLAMLVQVATGVAHEVNTPVSVITGNLQHLRDGLARGSPPGDAADCVEESIVASRRIAGIVRQLLAAGRVAGQRAEPRPLAVAPLVTEAARMARVAGEHVRIESRVPAELRASIEADALFQVLSNLLVNAVHAIPAARADGQVVVSAEVRDGTVRIEVADNGAGMPEEVLRQAFEPFFSTKQPGRGTGLGLAISRGLVTGAGGELRLESRPGSGTRAVIELPAAPPAAEPA